MKQRPGKVIRSVYATETSGQKESTEIISHEDYQKLSKAKIVSPENLQANPVASAGNPEEKKASSNVYYVASVQDELPAASLAMANNVPVDSLDDEEHQAPPAVHVPRNKKKSEKASPNRPVTPQSHGGASGEGDGPGAGGRGPAMVSPLGKMIKDPVRCILEIRRDAKRRANKLVPYWLRKRERKLKQKREAAS